MSELYSNFENKHLLLNHQILSAMRLRVIDCEDDEQK